MGRVLRSVDNALAVLESFRVERPELGVIELSHTLGLGKSTVHRLLTSLASRGYVRNNPQTLGAGASRTLGTGAPRANSNT